MNNVSQSIALENDNIRVGIQLHKNGKCEAEVVARRNGINRRLLVGDSLLSFTGEERKWLPFQSLDATESSLDSESNKTAVLTGSDTSFGYEVRLALEPNASLVQCTVRFWTSKPCRGWVHSAFKGDPATGAWIYPWLNNGRDVTPTLGEHRIDMDLPGHIHAALAGVPMIVLKDTNTKPGGRDLGPNGLDGSERSEAQNKTGDLIGGIGFALSHDYHHHSLAFERVEEQIVVGVGCGRNEGNSAFSGKAQYRPGTEYTYAFQVYALPGSYRELAWEWKRANGYDFDRYCYYTPAEALDMAVSGRKSNTYQGTTRYVKEDVAGLSVRGYRHSSHQQRISVYRQSLNAYVDYLLYQRLGEPVFHERASEQIAFLLESQHPEGWFQEDWQIVDQGFSYEVIGQDGGVTQVLDSTGATLVKPNEGLIWGNPVADEARKYDPRTGRNIRGPRPDYLGLTCLYLHKLIEEGDQIDAEVRLSWKESLNRCLAWLGQTQNADGSFPMTYSSRDDVRSEVAPCSRLLLALDRIASDRDDRKLGKMRDTHERWILDNCVEHQRWWGSHKDTGLTIDYGGLQTFIQYCVQRYERTGDQLYLELASECTYFNFFEHCPKQLEWLWHYSKGGIQEQSNYLQPDIDTMDNLPLYSWYRLAQATGDSFLKGWVDQALFTTMHTLCDDPNDPWYGSWAQYLVDYTGAVQRLDRNPVTENSTKYAGSITPNLIEDLIMLGKAGYVVPSVLDQD